MKKARKKTGKSERAKDEKKGKERKRGKKKEEWEIGRHKRTERGRKE
jgi:hypothetical protein